MVEKKTNEEILFPEPTKVSIGYGEDMKVFEILPLARKKYKKMFKILGDTIHDLVQQEEEDSESAINFDNVMESIPQLIDVAGDNLCEIYTIVLGESKNWIDNNMLMLQEVQLITAIFEQNDVEEIVKNFRKMAAQFNPNQNQGDQES